MARHPQGPAGAVELYDYFDRWNWDGTLRRIHEALYVKCREAAARKASLTAAIIPGRRAGDQPERQERRKREACIDPAGYDAGKKINGKKRHILVDTQGLLMHWIGPRIIGCPHRWRTVASSTLARH